MRQRAAPALIALLLLALPGATAAKETTDLRERLDALVQPYLDGDVLVGAVIGTWRDGEARVFAYGRLDAEEDDGPDRNTVYEIGSITKVFTGILLADLVSEGMVRLDQPVQELLPEGVTMPRHGDEDITLLDLATHSSGLPRMPSNFHPKDPTNPYADYDEARLFAYLKDAKLTRAPGATYEYSNLGMGLLGTVLARKAGKSYEQLVQARILEPLGLKSTGIALSKDMTQRLAPGYTAALTRAANWDLDAFAGAGAIRSTMDDMLRFVEANLAEEGTLHESIAVAQKIHYAPEGARVRMGLGWHAGSAEHGRWHNGGTGGHHSFLAIRPDEGLGVVVLANTSTAHVDALGDAVLRTLLGQDVKPATFRKMAEIDPKVLDDYVGTYRLTPDFQIEVTREGDQLFVQATKQPKVEVYPAGDDRFFLRVVEAEILFHRDEEGNVVRLTLFQNGAEVPGRRLP